MGRLLLTAALAVLFLTGCNDDDTQGGAPDDVATDDVPADESSTDTDPEGTEMQQLSVAAFQVAVPADWEIVDDRDDVRRAAASGTPSGAVVTVQRADGTVQDVREVAAAIKAQDRMTLPDFEESDWVEVEVAGADESLRDEATWTGDRDGEPVARRGTNVYTRDDDVAVVLMIQSDADDFDDSWVEPIVDSFTGER